ncbi:MAG: hypothetical protein KAQ75_03565 [Bacteroidales bacterium]|nr:hypothetical protein [Bacteroidales bacterium]
MNIRQRLLTVSNDIIPTMNLNFQNYLNERLYIEFFGEYPDINENLIRIETLIPTIEIDEQQFSIWSEKFQKLVEKNLTRKYSVSLNFAHQFCFNAICNYFEILSLGLFDSEAQGKFEEFVFFLQAQLNHTNEQFKVDYNRYWREFLLRLQSVFKTQETSFPGLFEREHIETILENLERAIQFVPPFYSGNFNSTHRHD